MRLAVKYIKVLLSVYMVCYFVLNATFVHVHKIDGKTITHSHPFKNPNHSHSESSATLIKIFNDTPAVESATPEYAAIFPEDASKVEYGYTSLYIIQNRSLIYFRGPPAV